MRLRRWIAVAAITAGVVPATGCGLPTDSAPRPLEDVPFGLVSPTTTVAADDPNPGERTYTARLYYVSGTRLVSTESEVPLGVTPEDQAGIVLDALAAGPPPNLPLRSVLTPSDDLSVSVRGSLATVELDEAVLNVTPSEQLFAIGQMVLSLTRVSPIVEVQFTVDDQRVRVPLPDGSSQDEPVTASDYLPLLTS